MPEIHYQGIKHFLMTLDGQTAFAGKIIHIGGSFIIKQGANEIILRLFYWSLAVFKRINNIV